MTMIAPKRARQSHSRKRMNNNDSKNIDQMLAGSAKQHHHLCPRQVLGVRMGILAGKILQLNLPQTDKRLVTIVETDGCMVDGVSAATNCTVGHRTLRVEDEGKIAATFVDTVTKRAVRIAPRDGIRRVAQEYSSTDCSRWEAQLKSYQCMPDDDLFIVKDVELLFSLEKLISRKGSKVICHTCEEEINNEREVMSGETVLCRSCVGQGYYRRPTQSGENETSRDVLMTRAGSQSFLSS
ncbi:MAG: hypothetical protein HW374_52 [Bacteroidetes bacterium]|nr:hypothetical protein [Bacteroidota bacterium]